MPGVLTPVLARLQGRWLEAGSGDAWIVDGCEAHVTHRDGRAGVVSLREAEGKVWCDRWFVDLESAVRAQGSSELLWAPSTMLLAPVVWRWSG